MLTNAVRTGAVHLGQRVLKKGTMDDYWLLSRRVILPYNMTFYDVTADHVEANSVGGVDVAKLSADLLRQTCEPGDRQVVRERYFAPLLVVQNLWTPSIVVSY